MNETIEGTEKLINFGQDMQQILKKVQTYNKKMKLTVLVEFKKKFLSHQARR